MLSTVPKSVTLNHPERSNGRSAVAELLVLNLTQYLDTVQRHTAATLGQSTNSRSKQQSSCCVLFCSVVINEHSGDSQTRPPHCTLHH